MTERRVSNGTSGFRQQELLKKMKMEKFFIDSNWKLNSPFKILLIHKQFQSNLGKVLTISKYFSDKTNNFNSKV